MRPRLLDLFCGAGGAAMGYSSAGFDVIGVDIKPQPNYPFEFHRGDALETLRTRNIHCAGGLWSLLDFDAIHASPPCQAYTEVSNDKSPHDALIAPVRDLLRQVGLPYVIENVKGAKNFMEDPVLLCGSSFGLRVRKHRYFEGSFIIPAPGCNHAWQNADKRFDVYEHRKWRKTGIVPVYGQGGGKANDLWPMAMGCGATWDECWMEPEELREAIPPAYTNYVGRFLLTEVIAQAH